MVREKAGCFSYKSSSEGNKENAKPDNEKTKKGAKVNSEKKSIPATSRFQNINDQHMKNITVYANGNPRVNFRFLLKSPRSQKLDYILDDVAVKISAKTGYAIRNLFAMSGEKITDAAQIRDGESYVAAGVEKFKRAAYGMSSATSQERPGRVRSRPLKPLKAPVKSQKETKEISGLKKPTKVQRKEALPPIAVAPVQKEPSDIVPDAPDIKTDLPIDQHSLPTHVSEFAANASDFIASESTETPDVVYSAPPGPLFVQDIEDEEELDDATANQTTTIISSRSAPDGMEFVLINPEDIPTVESTPEVPACEESQSRPSSKDAKVHFGDSPEAIKLPESNQEGEEADQTVAEQSDNEIEQENLISTNELTGEETIAEEQIAESRKEIEQIVHEETTSKTVTTETAVEEATTVTSVAPVPETPPTPKIESPLVENQHVKKWIDEEAVLAEYGIVECEEELSGAQILPPPSSASNHESTKELETAPLETGSDEETEVEEEQAKERIQNTLIEDEDVEASVGEVSAELDDIKKEVEVVVDRTEQVSNDVDLLSNVIDQVQELETSANDEPESEMTTSVDVMKDIDYVSRTDSPSTEGPDDDEIDERTLNDIDESVENPAPVMHVEVNPVFDSSEVNEDDKKRVDESDFVVEKAVGEDMLCRLSSSSTEGPDEDFSLIDDVSEDNFLDETREAAPENQQQDAEMTPSERESDAVEVIVEDEAVQGPEIVEQRSNEGLAQNDDENPQKSFEVVNFEEKPDFTATADEENEELVIRENDIKTDSEAQEKIIDSEDKEIEEESKEAIISENIDVKNADVIISEEMVVEDETKEAFVSENVDFGENDTLILKEPTDDKTHDAVIIENNKVDEMDQDDTVDLDDITADPIVDESIADDVCEADNSIVVENELEHVDNEIEGQQNAEADIGKPVESSNIDEEKSPEIQDEKIAEEMQAEGIINKNTEDIVSNEEIDTTDEVVVSSEVEESDQVIIPHPAITESQTPIDIDSPDIVTEIDITQANNVESQETTLEAVPEDSIIKDLMEKREGDGEKFRHIVSEKEEDIPLASETIRSHVTSNILFEQDKSPEEETLKEESSAQESNQESHIQDEPEEEPASEKFDLISALISTEPETTQNEHQAEELTTQEPEETFAKEDTQETVEDQTLLSGKTSHEDIIFEDTPSGPKIVDSEIPSISELEIPNEEEISHLLSSSSRMTLPSEETLDRRTDELIADDLSCEQVTFASIDTNSEDFIMSQSESTTTGLSTIAESFESRMDSSLTPNQASVTDDQSMEVLEAVQIIAQDAKLPLFQPELDSAIGSTTEDPNIITDLKNLEVVDISGQETSADSEITSENLAAEPEVSHNEEIAEKMEESETVQEDVTMKDRTKDEEIVEQEQLEKDDNDQKNDLETDFEVASSTEKDKTKETEEIMIAEKIQEEIMAESEAITHENNSIEEKTEEPLVQKREETLLAEKVDIVAEVNIEDKAIVEPEQVNQIETSTTKACISEVENVEQDVTVLDERKSSAEEEIVVAEKESPENDTEDQIQSDDQIVDDELQTEEPDQPTEINDAKIPDSEVEEKVKQLVEETVEKVCTVAEPTKDGPLKAQVNKEEEIIAEKIFDTTVERDLDLDSLEGDASEIKDETIDEVSDLPLESERGTSQIVTELLNQETETLEPQCGEEGLVIADESKEEVLDAEKVIIAEKIDDCVEVPQEISDEQKITTEVDIIESQNIPEINDVERSENIDQESLNDEVNCDNDEKILDKSAQSQEFEDEKGGAEGILAEVLHSDPEEEAKVDQTAVVELPSEKMPEFESSDYFVAEVSDGSEPSAVTLTESENDQTVIIAEPVQEIAEPTIQPLQISNSEQDLSQDASDLSEINCFKNPMLTSSSIEDDLSSEAVANIIMESQRKMEENKVVEENDDEFFSVESTTIMDNNDSPDVEPEYEEPLSVPEETGYRKSSCQLQRVPVLVSSRSVDTGLQENLQDEDDLDDSNIMNTILEDAMTKSEPIVQVSATQESTEAVEKTSTSVEIEKSANAATATSESIASITESESLEKVRSDKLALEDEAPENIQTEFALEQQVTEEVKEEIAELRSSSFAPQEEEEKKQEEEVVDEVKVNESADVDKFVGDLVSEAVQKARDEEQEKNEDVIEKTEDAESSEPAQVEETSAETKQETVDEPVDEINEDNNETEPEISEKKAEEIPVLEEKIDPEDQIEIVSSSAEIDDGKVDDEKLVEGKVEKVVEEKDDEEDNLEEIKEIETKEFPEIETAISDLQESQDNSARKSPSPAPEEQKEASIPEPKEESPEIPLTVIPDPEEKAAIEEAVKALSRPSEEAEQAQVEDEKVDEILEETDLVKQAISSAVEAINSEPASSTEEEKVEQKDEEPKVEESYQGSDPKELEDEIIKESIKEGVATLNKTDDSGAAGLSETSTENVEFVEPSEVELPASEVEESKEQTIDEKKDETSLLKDEGISDHFTSEKAAAAPSGEH